MIDPLTTFTNHFICIGSELGAITFNAWPKLFIFVQQKYKICIFDLSEYYIYIFLAIILATIWYFYYPKLNFNSCRKINIRSKVFPNKDDYKPKNLWLRKKKYLLVRYNSYWQMVKGCSMITSWVLLIIIIFVLEC